MSQLSLLPAILLVAAPLKCLTMFTVVSSKQLMHNVQPILDYSKLMQPPMKETDSCKLSPPLFSHPQVSGHCPVWESLIQGGKEAKMMKLTPSFCQLPQSKHGFQNYFFKSQKKLAIKIVFVYSMRISIIHILCSSQLN